MKLNPRALSTAVLDSYYKNEHLKSLKFFSSLNKKDDKWSSHSEHKGKKPMYVLGDVNLILNMIYQHAIKFLKKR